VTICLKLCSIYIVNHLTELMYNVTFQPPKREGNLITPCSDPQMPAKKEWSRGVRKGDKFQIPYKLCFYFCHGNNVNDKQI